MQNIRDILKKTLEGIDARTIKEETARLEEVRKEIVSLDDGYNIRKTALLAEERRLASGIARLSPREKKSDDGGQDDAK